MKSDFVGTGSMSEYVAKSNVVFEALSNMEVKMPKDYAGKAPELMIREGEDSASFVFDMNDAYMLDPSRVSVRANGEYLAPGEYAVYVSAGRLMVKVYV